MKRILAIDLRKMSAKELNEFVSTMGSIKKILSDQGKKLQVKVKKA